MGASLCHAECCLVGHGVCLVERQEKTGLKITTLCLIWGYKRFNWYQRCVK